MSTMQNTLEVSSLSAGYGRFDAVRDISLHVARGEAVALIGPNGAGKTTILHALMGQIKQRRGTVRIGGVDVSSFPTHRIAGEFAAIAPEGRHLFTDQSVEDNLVLGAYRRRGNGARVRELLDSVYELFPVLRNYRTRLASFLSGGEQQMVAIGRMLMGDAQLQLLDEPSIALSPVAVDIVANALIELRRRGASLLLVEQRVDVAIRVCDRLYVIAGGQIVEEMTREVAELQRDTMINKYLG